MQSGHLQGKSLYVYMYYLFLCAHLCVSFMFYDAIFQGSLVTEFLRHSKSGVEYTITLAADRHLYHPFHLLLMEKR